jgi:YD repeat-containing protein
VVERLFCKQRVAGSNPVLGFSFPSQVSPVPVLRLISGSSNTHWWLKELLHQFTVVSPSSTVTLGKNVYTYNNAGVRTANAITNHAGASRTEGYTYDKVNRLSTVNYGDGQTQSYAFDAMGNRTNKTDSVSGSESYTFNAANMLLSRGGNSYTNDLNGNTLTGGGRTNAWDSQNRLVSCVNGTKTNTFQYGADGLRRSMTTVDSGNSTTTRTRYLLDGQSVAQEYTSPDGTNWNLSCTYLMGPSGPMLRKAVNAADARWYLYDGLGSVLGEVDPNGVVTASRKLEWDGNREGQAWVRRAVGAFL